MLSFVMYDKKISKYYHLIGIILYSPHLIL